MGFTRARDDAWTQFGPEASKDTTVWSLLMREWRRGFGLLREQGSRCGLSRRLKLKRGHGRDSFLEQKEGVGLA